MFRLVEPLVFEWLERLCKSIFEADNLLIESLDLFIAGMTGNDSTVCLQFPVACFRCELLKFKISFLLGNRGWPKWMHLPRIWVSKVFLAVHFFS